MIRYTLPASAMTATLGQTISEMRAKISTTSEEATTGRWSDLTLHLSGRVGTALLSQKALDDVASDREILSLRDARLSLAQTSLTTVQDSASGIAANLMAALGVNDESSINLEARNAAASLDAVFTALNVRYGERYLFSGDATATQPFGDADQLVADIEAIAAGATDSADFQSQIDDYFNSPTGGWQTSIYQGVTTASDADAVPGTHAAITKIVSNLAIIAVSATDGPLSTFSDYTDIVGSAAIQLTEGETDVTNLRADLGLIQERIANDLANLDSEETLLTEAFNKLTARDQYEAAAELTALETTLEASYLLTARLSQLSLMNYLG